MVDSSSNPRVAFIHLDLGIGGAEALIVSMAQCLLHEGSTPQLASRHITLYTTRCEQGHCFSQVKQPEGALCQSVVLKGSFIPTTIFGRFTALLSNIRLCYLALCLVIDVVLGRRAFDVVVVDVLPIPIVLLKILLPNLAVCYYCHFPDKLLVRNSVNGVVLRKASTLRQLYRMPIDLIEELATSFADAVAVNSKFTASVFLESFPSLSLQPTVLYPAINLSDFVPPKDTANKIRDCGKELVLLSMNRFERKKNVSLAIEMLGELRKDLSSDTFSKIRLIIAGGYDKRNTENVEHLKELQGRCRELGLEDHVSFRPSVSDGDRASLLQSALCVLYTPHREHFGIVPLEAMYAGSPVVAVASGGPLETVVDGKTGYLCQDTPSAFAGAVKKIVSDVKQASAMGKAGHERVRKNFGLDSFTIHFKAFLDKSIVEKRGRSLTLTTSVSLFVIVTSALIKSFCLK